MKRNPTYTVSLFFQKSTVSSFSAGIPPKDAIFREKAWLWLTEIMTKETCKAIRECGLDGRIKGEEKVQEELFEKQIALDERLKKEFVAFFPANYNKPTV
ncbi:MAG: hypothetical protein FDW93_04535 [Bergeyella sp.]|nr:hypothetical protein [Bergeyella sp.]